ncbi:MULTISPECIES: Bug family tripartite tricarboxylate transporter substrate binding protein [unclassified Variovorax]|uniref:Bug family tripartite tricarboxylate transporter substrate binding protein n=1 Tax=unclassified Variovorax TaxID=663243 RepID=UPI0013162953|nr:MULTISPECIES: tripartite tricarboxylate transporter substrate binding protein [unclassified Variovorax]VTU45544.1 Argininosuccinate lyase [Variovorax sp. PBL-E5]VTU46515.1 Argininosuccinate lyase [Variovorax sp. SRS16]
MRRRNYFRVGAWLTAIALFGPWAAHAQSYPEQPIRMIVPYPPGGSTDLIARLYADGLGKELGQPIVVDNRPGAATNIGTEDVVRARRDGYTLLFGSGGTPLNSVFGPKPNFDAIHALAPVSLIARVPFMVAANPKAPFSNTRELIAAAKKSPGKFSISSAQLNVYVELMKTQAQINVLHVPYKGGAAATTDAVAGQVDMVYALTPVLLPQVQSGKLKAIGVTSARRLQKILPNVPTFSEVGVDYDIDIWYGLLAPASTPPAVLGRLNAATRKVVSDPQFVAKLDAIGAQAVSGEPGELRQQMVRDLATWKKLAVRVPSLLASEQK